MKPYAIEVSFQMVVMADSADHAVEVASDHTSDAWGDLIGPDLGIAREIESEADLKHISWDGMCLPYGGDGEMRLKDILAAIADEPTVDDKTVDMFAEQGEQL